MALPKVHALKGRTSSGYRGSVLGALADAHNTKPAKFPVNVRTGKDGKGLITSKPGPLSRRRINLVAVADALANAGMDPAVELVKVVQSGRLPPDILARVLNELLQYTQPKLKSVEVRAKVTATAFNVNDEQGRRIAEEFLATSIAQGVASGIASSLTEAITE